MMVCALIGQKIPRSLQEAGTLKCMSREASLAWAHLKLLNSEEMIRSISTAGR